MLPHKQSFKFTCLFISYVRLEALMSLKVVVLPSPYLTRICKSPSGRFWKIQKNTIRKVAESELHHLPISAPLRSVKAEWQEKWPAYKLGDKGLGMRSTCESFCGIRKQTVMSVPSGETRDPAFAEKGRLGGLGASIAPSYCLHPQPPTASLVMFIKGQDIIQQQQRDYSPAKYIRRNNMSTVIWGNWSNALLLNNTHLICSLMTHIRWHAMLIDVISPAHIDSISSVEKVLTYQRELAQVQMTGTFVNSDTNGYFCWNLICSR